MTKWNIRRALGYGAIAGALFATVSGIATEGVAPGTDPMLALLGRAIGGALAGAVMAGIVVAVLNLFARPSA